MTPATLERADFPDLFEQLGDDAELIPLADDEIIIDCFAGGGGASLGIEWATGRSPDEAINHSAAALAIHEANHPATKHHHSDVWEVDPHDVARGRRVGLLWLSPDCTHFSRAKGGKPVSKKIRVLAHVAVRYANAVRPRVILLENVEEFLTWGPVSRATAKPDPRRKGQSFRAFVRQLRRLGYAVEWRLLRGSDFGAPTSRRRLFLVARCDGAPIRFPKPTHGVARERPVRIGAECIDFSLPCPSIFMTKAEATAYRQATGIRIIRPLKPNTMRRIARGVQRFVIDAAEPFIVSYYSGKSDGDFRLADIHQPLPTVPTENRFGLVAPLLVPRYGEWVGHPARASMLDQPMPTIVPDGNHGSLVTAFLAKHYGDAGQRPGSGLDEPVSTVTPNDHNSLIAVHLQRDFGQSIGSDVAQPMPTVTGGVNGHSALVASTLIQFNRNCDGRSLGEPMATIPTREKFAEVRAFLMKYHGTGGQWNTLREPMPTVVSHDSIALVTVRGAVYAIADIGMRMLTARELANAQGFPPEYVLSAMLTLTTKRGTAITRAVNDTEQKAMVGNSVNPQVARDLVLANFGLPAARREVAA